MGISTYGIVYPPYNALVVSQSVQGITKVKSGWNIGVVNAINYSNIKVNKGASVLFNQQDSVLVTVGGTDYYLVEDEDIIFKENPAL